MQHSRLTGKIAFYHLCLKFHSNVSSSVWNCHWKVLIAVLVAKKTPTKPWGTRRLPASGGARGDRQNNLRLGAFSHSPTCVWERDQEELSCLKLAGKVGAGGRFLRSRQNFPSFVRLSPLEDLLLIANTKWNRANCEDASRSQYSQPYTTRRRTVYFSNAAAWLTSSRSSDWTDSKRTSTGPQFGAALHFHQSHILFSVFSLPAPGSDFFLHFGSFLAWLATSCVTARSSQEGTNLVVRVKANGCLRFYVALR